MAQLYFHGSVGYVIYECDKKKVSTGCPMLLQDIGIKMYFILSYNIVDLYGFLFNGEELQCNNFALSSDQTNKYSGVLLHPSFP